MVDIVCAVFLDFEDKFYCSIDISVVGEIGTFSSTMLNLTLCCLFCLDGGV